MKIKKGVIAAGGWSTRFLPAVKAYAKHLVPILDKPNIQYLVEEMVAAGIEEVAIVHRHGEKSIKQYFSHDIELEKYLKESGKEEFLEGWQTVMRKVKRWYFTPQRRSLPYGNGTPLLCVKNFVGKEPFVYMFGDDFLLEKKPGVYLAQMMAIFNKYQPAVVLGAQKVEGREIEKYGSIKYVKDRKYPNRAAAVLEKLAMEEAPSQMAQFGRFILSEKIFEALGKAGVGRGGELWLTDANNWLCKNAVVIAEPIKSGEWLTTGDPENWLKTNIKVWEAQKIKR